MHPVSSRFVAVWIGVVSLAAAFSGLDSLASGQVVAGSKVRLSQKAAVSRSAVAGASAQPRVAPPDTTDTWTGAGDGTSWNQATNWSSGEPNGSTVDVVIGTTTASVNENANVAVGSLTLSNAGDSLSIANNDTLFVYENISNAGTITLSSSGSATNLELGASLTLSGGGTLVLGGGGSNYINGVSGATLTNASTITGGGTTNNANIGNGQIGLVNNGTINANVSGTNLYVEPLSTATNSGTMTASNGGTLVLYGGTWTNTGGTISAATGSSVELTNQVSITGGTLNTTGTGVIYNAANKLVSLTNVTNNGTYQIQDFAQTNISGTITNNGNIQVNSTGDATNIYLTTNATLAGTGTLVLGGGGNNYINGAAGTTFTNASTITGGGTLDNDSIGNQQINLTNSGTVNANVSGMSLYLQPLVTGTNINTGTLTASNGGTLVFDGGIWTNTGGTISAAAGSAVSLTSGVSITGGTLTTSGSGVIETQAGGNVYLTSVTNNGTYNILNNNTTIVSGTITNNGTINLQSTSTGTDIFVTDTGSQSATLAGTGTVVLGTSGVNYIDGGSGSILTNDETISGVGNIGSQLLTLVNNGTINANISPTVSTSPLIIEPGTGGLTNSSTGILEATNGGTLNLNGGTITNLGTIEALGSDSSGNPSTIALLNGVSITGGTLTTTGAGVIATESGGFVYLTSLTNNGTFDIQDGNTTTISGTITNNGTINLQSAGNGTNIYVGTNSTLQGTGSVVLGSAGSNYINGATGTVLTNAETIKGEGSIGSGIALVNNGTINANVSAGTLTLEPAAASTNTKTLEATNGGTLVIDGGTWTQTGAGTISAATGSTVTLEAQATISGGTLTTTGTGVITNAANQLVSLTNVINNGTYQVLDNSSTVLTGTITNNGSFQVNSVADGTQVEINGPVILKGTGTLVLNGTLDVIFGSGTSPKLTNQSTIAGQGDLGNGQMGFTNTGTLDANVTGGAIAIGVNNSGFTNYNGTTDTLTGGTYINNGGNITFAAGNNGGITTLAANVTEENGGQLINTTSGSNALAFLTSITSTGSLTTDVNFTDAGAFSNAGSLTILPGTTFSVATLSQISGTTLTAGTYVLDANLSLTGATQTITSNAGNITLAGGTIENANSTNALAGLATNSGKLTIAGSSNNISTTATSFSNTGTLTINTGDSFTVSKLSQISGTTLSGGTFVLGGNLNVGSGSNITTNSSTLTLEGGTIMSGTANALLNLASNTRFLTLAGNANFTTTGNFVNSGTITVNSGSTFTVLSGKSLSNYKTATNTLQSGSYIVAGELAFNAGTTGAIETDFANITLEGTGELFNTSSGAASTNALANLATISSGGSFTLAQNANFTTNAAATSPITASSRSTAAAPLPLTGALTNLAGGTLTGGTYTVGGTLKLPSSNGGIVTNAANLTLTGTTAKILDGTANALAGFNKNTGTLTLSSDAALTTASSNFTNTGTVDVAAGQHVDGGRNRYTYSQTAGQTTIDGTLAVAGTGGTKITGGTILGAGTVKGNLAVGNASGTAATVNVGDSGKAGLLSITGKYTQLATGSMTGLINGTKVGTQFSQMKVTGAAALAGTINFTVASAFQASLTLGETFTVLTASSVTGTFSNSTIAINSSFHFNVTYSSTGVVLTVASGPAAAATGTALKPTAPIASAMAIANPASKSAIAATNSSLRLARGTSKITRGPVTVGWSSPARHSNAPLLATGRDPVGSRSWEHLPLIASPTRMGPPARTPLSGNVDSSRLSLPVSNLRIGGHAIGVQSPLAGWISTPGNRRAPAKILLPTLPHTMR